MSLGVPARKRSSDTVAGNPSLIHVGVYLITDSCFWLGVATGGLENQTLYLSWNFRVGQPPCFVEVIPRMINLYS